MGKTSSINKFDIFTKNYLNSLDNCFTEEKIEKVHNLADNLVLAWKDNKKIFICGNGGSAGNAIHIANDFIYGAGACGESPRVPGLNVEALTANSAVLTCLANDTGFENIFSHQLEVKAEVRDILIVLSGSGNSANVVNAIKKGNLIGMETFAIVAFNGGECKKVAKNPIHFETKDMQIAEDIQLVIGHLCMQWLSKNKPQKI